MKVAIGSEFLASSGEMLETKQEIVTGSLAGAVRALLQA